MTHWKRPWCWERLKVGAEGDNRGWDGWMASPTRWTWVWVNSRSWWWTGRPGVLQSMGSQRVGHDWVTEWQQSDQRIERESWVESVQALTLQEVSREEEPQCPFPLFFCFPFPARALPSAEPKLDEASSKGSEWIWREERRLPILTSLSAMLLHFTLPRAFEVMRNSILCLLVDYFCGRKKALWKQGICFGFSAVF